MDSLVRSAVPDPQSIGSLTTSWQYDRAGRVLTETDAQGASTTSTYDHAGNVLTTTPRHLTSGSITMQYDELNRLVQRDIPGMHYDSIDDGLANLTPAIPEVPATENPTYPRYPTPGAANNGYDTPTDTEVFAYDAVGNMTTARNTVSEVTRVWNQEGTLASETLKIAEVEDTTAMATHVYKTDFEYDKAGRITKIEHPSNLWPSGVSSYEVEYEYDALSGLMSKVIDPDGNEYEYFHNNQSQPDSIAYPGGLSEMFDYYPDGRLERHQLHNADNSPPNHSVTWLRDDMFTYDLRGKLATATGAQGSQDQFAAKYSGLGYLMEQTLDSHGITITGNPIHYFRIDAFTYDGLGSQLTSKDSTYVFTQGGGGGGNQTILNSNTYTYATADSVRGRLWKYDPPGQGNEYNYDAAGNLLFLEAAPDQPYSQAELGAWDDRVTFYDATGRVAAAEHGYHKNKEFGGGFFRRTQEDYRYDALGRRILVRMRQFCANHEADFDEGCRVDWVRRTVWAGDRELWEIQVPDSTGYREMDVGIGPAIDFFTTAPVDVDMNPQFGRVAYTYGLGGIDQPIALHRMDYSDHAAGEANQIQFDPFTLSLFWNYKGFVDNSAYADGAKHLCDATETTRCVLQAWPHAYFAYSRNMPDLGFWHGTLVRDKRDGTGTSYRRNRYYDPVTGQFTQEDPIGLAGGLNLYGFAAGDPVNFSDAFGLSPGCIVNPAKCARQAAAAIGSVAGTIGRVVSLGLGGITGVNAAAVAIAGLDFGGGGVSTSDRLLAGGEVALGLGAPAARAPSSLARVGAKLGGQLRATNRAHLSAAARELADGGGAFDHVTEVRNAMTGLRNTIGALEGILGNPHVSPEVFREASRMLGQASRALDAAEDVFRVPR